MKKILLFISFLILAGCMKIPGNIKPVEKFNVQQYLGKWYEIARLDHSFERGLEDVSAEYSLRPDGGIKVINRGYNPQSERWKQAEGKAYFIKDSDTGLLKVSFFGPFYGAYIIADLDSNYQHALVAGPDTSYLWILSRHKQIPKEELNRLVDKAGSLGFDTDKLIYVSHNR